MSTVLRPSGRRSAAVYWRRRLVLVAVLLLVAYAVLRLTGVGAGSDSDAAGSGDDPTTAAETEPSESDSAGTDGPDESDQSDRPARPERPRGDRPEDEVVGPRTVAVSLPRATAACDPAEVEVVPSIRTTDSGDDVPLALTMRVVGDEPCELDLSAATPLIEVRDADGDEVWSAARCAFDQTGTGTVRLDPAWATRVDAVWSGLASGSDCDATDASYAEPGDYSVVSAYIGGEPVERGFTLSEPPPPPDPPKPDRPRGDDDPRDGEGPRGDQQDDQQEGQQDDQQGDVPGAGDDGIDDDAPGDLGADEP